MVAQKIVLLVVGYILGGIPFGVIISKRFGTNILAAGSGNPGATNVWRTVGPKAGAIVFLLDMLKGCLPAIAGAALIDPRWGLFAGFAAVFGHMLSPFLGFKGGKGIATAFGAGLGSVPLIALSAIAVFFVLLAASRYVSLASIIAVGTAVLFGFVFYGRDPVIIVALAGLEIFIIYKHRANITRLLDGTESKFSFKSRNNSRSETNPTDNDGSILHQEEGQES